MNYLGESCTDYGPIVKMAADKIGHLMPTQQSSIESHLAEFVQHKWYAQILPANSADRDKNEIMMFDNHGDYPEGGTLYFAFTEAFSNEPVTDTDHPQGVESIGKFGNRLGFVASLNCWGPSATAELIVHGKRLTEAKACADPSKRASGDGYTTDIVLLRTQVDHDALEIPSDVRFNTCPVPRDYFVWLPVHYQKNLGNSVYGTLVHEAGHALGLHHPIGEVHYSDSVMTAGVRFSCSPHPLDVLTVHALYRAR